MAVGRDDERRIDPEADAPAQATTGEGQVRHR
jgi:hypothetical protein